VNTKFCQRCVMLNRAIPAPAEIFYAGRKGKHRFHHLCSEHVVEWRARFPELAVIYSAAEWEEYQAAQRVERALLKGSPEGRALRAACESRARREHAAGQRHRCDHSQGADGAGVCRVAEKQEPMMHRRHKRLCETCSAVGRYKNAQFVIEGETDRFVCGPHARKQKAIRLAQWWAKMAAAERVMKALEKPDRNVLNLPFDPLMSQITTTAGSLGTAAGAFLDKLAAQFGVIRAGTMRQEMSADGTVFQRIDVETDEEFRKRIDSIGLWPSRNRQHIGIDHSVGTHRSIAAAQLIVDDPMKLERERWGRAVGKSYEIKMELQLDESFSQEKFQEALRKAMRRDE